MLLQSILLDIPSPTPTRTLVLILLPIAFAGLGVYLLLPRPRGSRPLWGAACAGVALFLAGWLLIRSGTVVAENVLFYSFSAIAIVSGGMLVTQRNPVRAALSFALVVLSTCGLFLLQAAPFLMAATIIIYAGAIVVTFLFVIMLAQQAGISDADQRSREPFLSCMASFVLLGAILCMLFLTYDTERFDALLVRADQAAKESTPDGITKLLGNGNDFFDTLRREGENAHLSPAKTKDFKDALGRAEETYNSPTKDMEEIKKSLTRLYEAGIKVRDSYGNLQPPDESSLLPAGIENKRQKLRLSTYSRLSSAEPLRDSEGRPLLPAENVAYLGRALFSDYLLPVELGGTLLLVATIGAIAIAGRRPEGLR